MHRTKSLSTNSVTVAGIAASLMLGFAGVALSPAPARAVVYCQYTEYPVGCVARAGVVLRPRPVARAAVRMARRWRREDQNLETIETVLEGARSSGRG